METFSVSTKIIIGSASEAVQAMQIQKLLVVTDPYFSKNGTARSIAQAQEVTIFDRVTPDPELTLAAQGASLVQAFQPNAILALGGGSAMDCAKAMAFFSGLSPTLIAIPTTSGSGADVTDFAILTHQGIKHPLVDEKLRPHTAILDESLLQALPPALIADGGFDLISHALEAIAATGAGVFSDTLAKEAFCTALKHLPSSFAGCTQVRKDIHTAATMAGMAFSCAGLGLCHAAAHALGGEFHVPHGRLNAILLPSVIEYNAAAAIGKYAALARSAGLGSGADPLALRALKNALLRLRRVLQLPDTLAKAGIAPEALLSRMDTLTDATLADPCCKTNPVPVTREGVQCLLREVMGRG